jgi:hypothetical protein
MRLHAYPCVCAIVNVTIDIFSVAGGAVVTPAQAHMCVHSAYTRVHTYIQYTSYVSLSLRVKFLPFIDTIRFLSTVALHTRSSCACVRACVRMIARAYHQRPSPILCRVHSASTVHHHNGSSGQDHHVESVLYTCEYEPNARTHLYCDAVYTS